MLLAPSSYVDVPEYLWYGEELARLSEKLEEVNKQFFFIENFFIENLIIIIIKDPRYMNITKPSLLGPAGAQSSGKDWLWIKKINS